jgi:hypothetical protein
MNSRFSALAAGLVWAFAALLPASAEQPPGPPGRYQALVGGEAGVLMLDTATGRTWRLTLVGPGGEGGWQWLVLPFNAPPATWSASGRLLPMTEPQRTDARPDPLGILPGAQRR